jgi:hypothetical protein
MSDDFIINVRQIAQYPLAATPAPTDLLLLQQGGLGGSYAAIQTVNLVANALVGGATFNMAPGWGIAWNGVSLGSDGLSFLFSAPVEAPQLNATELFLNGQLVATVEGLDAAIANLVANSVQSFNFRTGAVQLQTSDILQAGGAPIQDAHFGGFNTSPTPWDFRQSDDQIATTAFVQNVVTQLLCGGSVVTSFNGRGGAVTLLTADVNAAYAMPGPPWPTAPSPALGDASNRIATTLFVDDSLADLQQWLINYIASGAGANLSQYALLASPAFTGVPTAPTAAVGSSTGQLATTAFVQAAVTASTTGVSSFNTRTGAVTLTAADLTAAGGAPLASPSFTGVPAAPTAANGTSSTQLATTAFVMNELAAGTVASFNTRVGAVTLTLADITGAGGAPIASPALTGTPTAPTAAQTVNNTQVATTAYVRAAITAIPADVTSFNGRTGAITLIGNDISAAGGALLAAPAFTGIATAPTAAPGTNTTQLATTAFVEAAVAGGGGVASFNGRTGVVTLSTADVTGAGGAPLASPVLTGVPLAPQPAVGTSTNQLATCSFVMAQIATGITSFNSRTGAVTLSLADVTGAGGAPLASPTFTGSPQSTTPTPATDNSTRIATTAFVQSAVATNAVASFNGRTGAVTFQAADVSAVGGALLAGPAFTGAPTAPTATAGTSTTQLATTQFVMAALAAGGGVTSFNTRSGAVTLTAADVTGVGGALLASPTFTGIPAGPTAAPGTNTTQLATTAFIAAALAGGVAATPTYAVSVYATAGAATFTTAASSTTGTSWRVRMVGGGAGGGGVGSTGASGGGGGGAGQYRELIITNQAPNTAWTLAIGANGTGGGTGGSGATGTAGTATSLTIGGVAVACNGGSPGGGAASTAGATANGGNGGNGGAAGAISGMTVILSQNGQPGQQSINSLQAAGGSGPLGTGGEVYGQVAANNLPASGYGAGGYGGPFAGAAGGAGTVGVIIIERIDG